jgi:uncharacterized RDD family membrane protein YckC
MEVLDQTAIQTNQKVVKYGTFWPRLGATIIDGLILAPLTLGLAYFNVTTWKSTLILVAFSLVGVIYKPFMELNYGATFGKMALNLKVVNLQFDRPNLSEILLRNVFHLAASLLTLLFTLQVYSDPEFESVTGFMEYSAFSQQFVALRVTGMISGLLTLVDGVIMVADERSRSLHDKIGKTYVIQEP